jgi:hypothetical protein
MAEEYEFEAEPEVEPEMEFEDPEGMRRRKKLRKGTTWQKMISRIAKEKSTSELLKIAKDKGYSPKYRQIMLHALLKKGYKVPRPLWRDVSTAVTEQMKVILAKPKRKLKRARRKR